MILAEALVRSHVEALKRRMPKPQAAILGCTHYPLVEDVFRDALGDGVAVYSQPSLVAASLADYLDRRPEMLGPEVLGSGEAAFLTTGDPKSVEQKATLFLRRKIEFEGVG
jgi:glutamate racemase